MSPASPSARPAIGFIGVGSMGAPMAANLLGKGYPVTVHDVHAPAVAALVQRGATGAASARAVAAACETVFICLPSLDSIREVLLGADGLHHGGRIRIVANCSTVGPSFVRELTEGLTSTAIKFIDCPVTGGADAARGGSLSITVSGSQDGYAEIRPLLDCLAAHIFYVGGEPGQAQLMKLINNMLSFAAFVSACEAFALGVKAGLDPDVMVEVINTGTGRNSATTHKFPKNILPRTFDYGAKMMISYKDITLFLEEAERFGVPTWLAPVVKQVIGYAISQDGDGNDVSTLVRHYEKWCGIEIAGAAARGKPAPR
jgi:3-hydroxyisobutyrate dehydrogenase-like beta-hydroxyacid dehydrogenase